MSSDARPPPRAPSPLRLCACSPRTVSTLVAPARRFALRVLLERGTVPSSELVSVVAAASQTAASGASPERPTDASVSFYHVHLPRLEAAGLVEADGTGTLALGSHSDLHDGSLTPRLLGTVEQDVWTALAAVTSDRLRADVVAALARSGPTTTLDQVVTYLAEAAPHTADEPTTKDRGSDADLAATLHHVHLPKLDAVGLVAYDHADHEVSYAARRWFGLDALAEALERPRLVRNSSRSDASRD